MTSFPATGDAERIASWPVISADGDTVGAIEALYADRGRGTLEWAAVDTGIAARRHLVPLADAFVADGFLQVGYSKERCLTAPVPDHDQPLDEAAERRLYEHFGLPWEEQPAGQGEEPEGLGGGAEPVLVRRPSLLERIARS